MSPASVRRDGDALVFAGALDRAAVPAVWKAVQPLLDGARQLQLAGVVTVDSAGVALLAEIVARSPGLAVSGDPDGLADLRAAYRLSPSLDFTT